MVKGFAMSGDPRVKFLEECQPIIAIDPKAYAKMALLVSMCSEELSWFGTVTEAKTGTQRTYTIEEIYVPEQEVSASSADFSPEDMNSFAEELLKLDDGMKIANSIRFWGHSHVDMTVGPSGTDDTQMNSFIDGNPHLDFMIMGIFNKQGDCRFDIHYFELGCAVENVRWYISTAIPKDLAGEIAKLIEQNVKVKTFTNYQNEYPHHNANWPENSHLGDTDVKNDLIDDEDDYETMYPGRRKRKTKSKDMIPFKNHNKSISDPSLGDADIDDDYDFKDDDDDDEDGMHSYDPDEDTREEDANV